MRISCVDPPEFTDTASRLFAVIGNVTVTEAGVDIAVGFGSGVAVVVCVGVLEGALVGAGVVVAVGVLVEFVVVVAVGVLVGVNVGVDPADIR